MEIWTLGRGFFVLSELFHGVTGEKVLNDDKKRGAIVLVMQRLHQHDLSDYLLAKSGWKHLSLPAVAPVPEVFSVGGKTWKRDTGILLHEERETLAGIKQPFCRDT